MTKKLRSVEMDVVPPRELSRLFRSRLQDLVRTVMDYPEIREEKVRELRCTIAMGEYACSNRDLADAILSTKPNWP